MPVSNPVDLLLVNPPERKLAKRTSVHCTGAAGAFSAHKLGWNFRFGCVNALDSKAIPIKVMGSVKGLYPLSNRVFSMITMKYYHMGFASNVCLIKNRSKVSNELLLCLLRIFMRQTLPLD